MNLDDVRSQVARIGAAGGPVRMHGRDCVARNDGPLLTLGIEDHHAILVQILRDDMVSRGVTVNYRETPGTTGLEHSVTRTVCWYELGMPFYAVGTFVAEDALAGHLQAWLHAAEKRQWGSAVEG